MTDREKAIALVAAVPALHRPGLSAYCRALAALGRPFLRRHRAARVPADDGTSSVSSVAARAREAVLLEPRARIAASSVRWPALAFVVVFYRLAALDVPNAETASRLMLAFPVSFILFAPYTESLWLLFAALSFWYMRKERLWLAGARAHWLCSLDSRAIFLSCRLHTSCGSDGIGAGSRGRRSALIPLALVGWMLYRSLNFSDVHPDFSSFNSLLYTTVLAPSAHKGRGGASDAASLGGPFGKAITITQQYPTRGNILNLVLGAVMVMLAVVAWPRMRVSYRILTVICSLWRSHITPARKRPTWDCRDISCSRSRSLSARLLRSSDSRVRSRQCPCLPCSR